MERAISEMEKIRRAEEIYSRRKNGETFSFIDKENSKKSKSIYRILFQFLLFINIAVIVVMVQNKDYIFSKDFLLKTNKYNVNIKSKVNELVTYFNKEIENSGENTVENSINDNSEYVKLDSQENLIENVNNNIENNTIEKESDNDNIENVNEVRKIDSSLSQMELDINYIKSKYKIICPVNGVKTSSFGLREGNEIVTKYHTGVDIANDKGTVVKSAIDGKVIQVSTQGDYGKHLRISIDDIVTLYAHCDKIYVKEGDEIKQGQDIAEVGSTGNSTGNHLHFEIRYQNRYVDPEKLIEI